MNGLSDVRLVLHGQELQALSAAPKVSRTGAAAHFSRWQLLWMRYRTRRQLLRLDSEQLRDIGVSRVDALQEGAKPFWQE